MGVGLVAGGIAAALIVVSVVGSSDSKSAAPTTTAAADAAAVPGSTPAVTASRAAGAAATAKLFRGIPQKLNVLGNPNAPVTMIEFADLQCPFCRDYALDALPAIVQEYVRPGKVKLVFGGIRSSGPTRRPHCGPPTPPDCRTASGTSSTSSTATRAPRTRAGSPTASSVRPVTRSQDSTRGR